MLIDPTSMVVKLTIAFMTKDWFWLGVLSVPGFGTVARTGILIF